MLTNFMTFKKVKLIEQSNLDLDQRIELILIYSNQKPATILYLREQNRKYKNIPHYNSLKKQQKETQTILDKIKLLYKTDELISFNAGYHVRPDGSIINIGESLKILPIYVAKNPELILRLKKAQYLNDSYELGRLYGFPDTAIEAFHGVREPFMGCMRDNTPKGYFTQFVFSEEYFKEEYRSTTLRWHDCIKRLSSKTYKELQDLMSLTGNSKARIEWR